jgi:hypothetical protein
MRVRRCRMALPYQGDSACDGHHLAPSLVPKRDVAIRPEALSHQRPLLRRPAGVHRRGKVGIFGPMKTALRNVRVFDGRQLLPPGTVVLDGDCIGADASGAKMVVDGGGGCSCPG